MYRGSPSSSRARRPDPRSSHFYPGDTVTEQFYPGKITSSAQQSIERRWQTWLGGQR